MPRRHTGSCAFPAEHVHAQIGGKTRLMVQAIDLVRERLQKNEEPEAICKAMCDHCMAPDTQVGHHSPFTCRLLLT